MSKINNLKAYITSLVFSLAESCKTTIRTQFAESTTAVLTCTSSTNGL